MKKTLVVGILFLSFALVFSQNLIDKNKQWNVYYSSNEQKTISYKFLKDTIIKNTLFTSLYFSYSEEFDSVNSYQFGFISEENNIVKIRFLNGETYTLFDFNVQLCDTFEIKPFHSVKSQWYAVEHIDSIKINQKNHYIVYLVSLDSKNPIHNITWIKGIGSNKGLVESLLPNNTKTVTELLCIKSGGREIWKNYRNTCYIANNTNKSVVWIKNKEDKNTEINIENIKNTNLKLKIYSEKGNLVKAVKIKSKKDLSFTNLHSGVYIIEITDYFDRIYMTKVIRI